MNSSQNPTERAGRRYMIQVGVAGAVYIVVLVGSLYAVQWLNLQGAARYALLLLPLIPVIAIVPVVLRYFRETDEFERQISFESLAIAAGVTAVYAVTCGFLEVAGMPKISAWYTWLVVMGTWGVARIVLRWRYR